MSTAQLNETLESIQGKLDHITIEIDRMKRQREEMEELKKDLTIIAGDVFSSLVKELDEVAPFVNSGDFTHLGKQLLRNTNNISNGLTKLEGAADLMEDLKPIGKDLFRQVLMTLDELEKRGYTDFIKGMIEVLDNIVVHFSADDIKALSENIVTILETVKELTQPQMLTSVENMLTVFRRMETENIEEYSVWKAVKELNTPEMKRGIGFMMTFLKHVIKEPVNITGDKNGN